MNSPEVLLSIIDSVWCKQMHFLKAGDVMEGHKHIHDHITLLAKGSVEVCVNDTTKTTFTSPHMIFIAKDDIHKITALEDNTIAYCIHALRNYEDGDIVDPSMRIENTESLIT